MKFKLLIIVCKVGFLFGLGWIVFGVVNLFLFNCLFNIFEFKEAKIDRLIINKDYDPSLFGIHYEFKVNEKGYSETYMIPKSELFENYRNPESVVVIYNTFFPKASYIKGFRQAFRGSVLEISIGIFFCLYGIIGTRFVKGKFLQKNLPA